MTEAQKFLKKAYKLKGGAHTKSFYKDWAASYEQEIKDNGYATPYRCAAALAACQTDKSVAVLDLGCGTGLSGEALKAAGFATLDGTDFSQEMLTYAQGKQGLYRSLKLGNLDNPLPAEPGVYGAAAAVGVFSPGHATAEMIGKVMDLLTAGGCFVFSLNDNALKDPSYETEIAGLQSQGLAEEAFREYGDHLPKIGMKCIVCVLRRV